MSPLAQRIEAEIKMLPANEQVELLERLETMLYGQDEEDPAFIETLNRRVAEIESGKVKGIPVEETFEKINRELKAKYS
jgi:putative addiction module component (TIGR02574 family)